MDQTSNDKCADCGKTRSNVASITQWIMRGDKCSCGAPSESRKQEFDTSESASPRNKICARCGGSISKQDGSLTQWVFRTTPCKCSDGGTFAELNTNSSDSAQEDASSELADDYDEIETETGRFPKDRYRALSLIGSGEQGDVYKAQDKLLNRIVCIKVLRTEKLLPEQAVRFQQEAKTGGKLTHPNLTTVLDFGLTEAGQPFLVMEFCSGKSLSEIIHERGPLPETLAMKLFYQLCEGVQYAHEHGILHRDLKTTNILISGIDNEIPQVKIIDFGLAGMVLDTMGDTGRINHNELPMGTPAYMSPEQVNQKKVDQRSDLYSLGCIMFETLAGRPVFEEDNAIAVLNMQVHTPAPALSEASDTEFNPALESIVDKLLAKDPSARFQTSQELKVSLEEIIESDKFVSHPAQNSSTEPLSYNSDYARLQAAVLAASEANTKNKSISKPLVAVLIVATVIAGTFLMVSSVISDDSKQVSKDLVISELSLADGNWQVAGGEVHGANAKKLEELKTTFHLKIVDPNFADSDLVHLRKLPLKVLDLSGTKITNSGLKEVSKIKSLMCLILNNNSNITDEGISNLELPNLRVLSLSSTRVTDAGVSVLTGMPSLTSIDISNLDKVTVKSIHELSKLPMLGVLRIGNTGIKPENINDLREIKMLKVVSLANLGLSDADIDNLLALPDIRLLDVSGNKKITAAGIQKLNPLRYWRLTYENCGMSKEEKNAVDTKAIQDAAQPIPMALDYILPPENDSLDIDREVYSFWYNPKYGNAQYFVDAAKNMYGP